MKIPAYWAKSRVEDQGQDGRTVQFSCWRSSDRSQQDAQEAAFAAATRILRNFISGKQPNRYDYGETPLREETFQKVTDARGELIAAVTRNAYGVLVLNTRRVMFIDLDLPATTVGQSVRHSLRRLFGRSGPSPVEQYESEMKDRLARFVDDNPTWGMRLYRTCAGLRALVTHDLFDPTSESTLSMLRSVGSDPLYVRLCKAQNCFRARLTPKPWRCDWVQNPVRWPFEDQAQQARFDRWQAGYVTRQSQFATCRFLGALGRGAVHPEAAELIDLHDRATRCDEPLNLA